MNSNRKVLLLVFVPIALIFIPSYSEAAGIGSPCIANGQVPGLCADIKKCHAALGYLRANVTLPPCQAFSRRTDTTFVCCPTIESKRISATKCEAFQNVLRKTTTVTPLLPPIFLPNEDASSEIKCDPNLNALISGGRDAKLDEMPFMVALGYDVPNIPWRCGGTLISPEFVITAAHCVLSRYAGRPTKLLLGDITLSKATSKTREIIGVSKVIAHPQYQPPLTYHDIALIKMSRKVNISKSIRPACLPQAKDDLLRKVDTKNFTAAGFGITGAGEAQSDSLQVVNLRGYNWDTCNKFYRGVPTAAIKFPYGITRTQVCAGDSQTKDTCQGDSGGPLLLPNDQKRCIFYVAGITSFGPSQGGEGAPAIYTNVLSYLDWIEDVVWGNNYH